MRKLAMLSMSAGLLFAFAAISVHRANAAPAPFQRQPRSVIGFVRGSHDEALGQAIVYLKNTKTQVIKTYIADDDGSYRFHALSPNVDYEVYALHNGSRSDTKTVSAFDSRKEVRLNLKIKTDK